MKLQFDKYSDGQISVTYKTDSMHLCLGNISTSVNGEMVYNQRPTHVTNANELRQIADWMDEQMALTMLESA